MHDWDFLKILEILPVKFKKGAIALNQLKESILRIFNQTFED